MKGVFNQVIKTFVWPDDRTVECQNISKTLGQGEELKIIGMSNPHFASTFGNSADGFKLEVLDGVTTIIKEEILIQKTVTVVPGELAGSITQ